MPKNTAARIIDEPKRSGLAFVGGGGGGGGGGVTDHGLLSGLTDDDHPQYHTDERGDLRYVPLARTVSAGSGLSGGGALSANVSLALASSAAGAALSYNAGVLAVVPGEGLEIETDAIGLASSVAGAGLAYSAGVLSVNAGALLEVAADAVKVANGAAWQFAATNAGGSPLYRDVADLAGAGLTAAAGVLGVGQGAGLTVSADAVALTTPGTLTVSTANNATGSHTHGITSSSDPNQSASLLATNAQGASTLRNLFVRQAAQSYATFASGFAGSGWRADYGLTESGKASAEFDNLTIRGRTRFYELLIQQIRATNGSTFVSSASKVVSVTTSTNPAWTVNGQPLTFNGAAATFNATIYTISTAEAGDTGRELYHGFLYGDLIRAQQVNWNGSSYDLVMQSNLEVTGVTDLYTYQAALVSGSAPAAGYDYVRVGNTTDSTRRGSIYLTSDDSNAPFIDIVDGVRYFSDWNSAGVARVRVGKLTGISDAAFGGALGGYGLYGNNVYLKGQMVITGGSLGGLAASDVNANTTTIDGGKITANSITALQIAAGTITTSLLNFVPVLTSNVVASINATAEGIRIAANRINIDGTTVFGAGYDPTTKATPAYVDSGLAGKINAGGAAADVNANVTTISGGKITTGSITADKISVGDLSALGATIGSWVIGSSDITSGGIRLASGVNASVTTGTGSNLVGITTGAVAGDVVMWGGSSHANRTAAPYRLTLAGSLYSTDATFGTMKIDTSGAFVTAPSSWDLAYGYKFKIGTTLASGLTLLATSGLAYMGLWNNTANDAVNAAVSNIDSTIYIKNVATGSGRTSKIELAAHQLSGGVAALSLESNGSTRRAVFTVDTADGLQVVGGYKVWHAGNDGHTAGGTGVDADLLDGSHASAFAAAAHTHAYLSTSGGTVSGATTIDGKLTVQANPTGSEINRYIDIGLWKDATTQPATPPANYARLFLRKKDASSGKVQLGVVMPDGNFTELAIEV